MYKTVLIAIFVFFISKNGSTQLHIGPILGISSSKYSLTDDDYYSNRSTHPIIGGIIHYPIRAGRYSIESGLIYSKHSNTVKSEKQFSNGSETVHWKSNEILLGLPAIYFKKYIAVSTIIVPAYLRYEKIGINHGYFIKGGFDLQFRLGGEVLNDFVDIDNSTTSSTKMYPSPSTTTYNYNEFLSTLTDYVTEDGDEFLGYPSWNAISEKTAFNTPSVSNYFKPLNVAFVIGGGWVYDLPKGKVGFDVSFSFGLGTMRNVDHSIAAIDKRTEIRIGAYYLFPFVHHLI